MDLMWKPSAWDEYVEWVQKDKTIARKINALIKDMLRHPFEGIGKPEPLKGDLASFWSRRITDEHRLVYMVDDETVKIFFCKGHYE